MPKVSWSPAVKQRVSHFLEKLLSYVLDYRDDLPVQYRWEDEYSDRPKLIVEAKLRFLIEISKLEKNDHFYEIINRLKDLNLCEDRRFHKKGKDDWHFTLKLWSKDKQKNLIEFDKFWESQRPEKSKKLDNHQTKFKILGKLSQVPEQPLNFLPRPDQLNKIKSLLLDNENQRVAVTGISHRVGLQGMGGIGKSVLAAILAHDEDIRSVFPDGILWVTLGQQPALTLRQLDLAKMLGDSSQIFQDVQQGRVHLRKLLTDKACLLIIDDIWQSKHADAFNVVGQQSKILITTRDSKVLKEFGAVEHTLGLLEDEEALVLLALWANQDKEKLPIEAQEVVKECGNLPLALAMIGAIVRDKPDRWVNLLHKLRNADLEKIRHQFSDYSYPDLLKAMQVSVDALESDVKKRYLDFAVFPEDTPIPEAVLKTFWKPEGLDEFDTQDVVDILVDRSLARRDDKGCLTLHDLQYDYVRKQAGDLVLLHNQLLTAYAKCCSNGWHTGQNDGYFFENLAYHLRESGRKEELYALLTQSPDWMEAKFIACQGDTAYVADLQLAINDFADPIEPKQLLTLCQLQTARQVVNQRVSNYDDIDLETLVLLGRETEAINYARLRERLKQKFYGLLTVFKALQAKNNPQYLLLNEIKDIAFSIQNNNWNRATILIDLSLNLCLCGFYEEANKIIRELDKNINIINLRDTYLLTKIGEIYDRLGNGIEANTLFEKAILIANNKDNLWHKSYDLSRLSVTLFQLNRFEEAKKIVNMISLDCVKASALSKLALILTQKGFVQEAEAIFSEIQILVANNNLFNYSEQEKWVNALGKLFLALNHAKKQNDADESFIKARKLVDDTDRWLHEKLTKDLASYLAEAKEFNKSYELACTIPEGNRFRIEALRELANNLAKCEQMTEAKRVFIEAQSNAYIVIKDTKGLQAISNIAVKMDKVGFQLKADILFNKLEEILVNRNNDHQEEEMWSALAIGYIRANRFQKAEETIQKITLGQSSSGISGRIKALCELSVNLHQNEQIAEADRILAEASLIAYKYLPIFQSFVPLSELVKAKAKIGRLREAEELAYTIEDDLQYTKALCIVGAILANTGAKADAHRVLTKAREAAYAVESHGRKELAVWAFAAALAQSGNFDEAKKEIQTLIHSDWQRYEGVAGLAAPLANIGNFVEAFTTLGLQKLDKFLFDLTEWTDAFEKVQPNLSIEVMREVVRIAGWISPQWQEIYQIFPDAKKD